MQDQSDYLSVLCQTPAERIKPFVDQLLTEIDEISVLENRTGLIMVPFTDTVEGAVFHLGEVLVAEARVTLGGAEGYAAVMGRDLEQALAVAICDAALQDGKFTDQIQTFIEAEAKHQAATDEALLRTVEKTRVEMETF